MIQLHGLKTPDADSRMEVCVFAIPANVLRGTPGKCAIAHLTSLDSSVPASARCS